MTAFDKKGNLVETKDIGKLEDIEKTEDIEKLKSENIDKSDHEDTGKPEPFEGRKS